MKQKREAICEDLGKLSQKNKDVSKKLQGTSKFENGVKVVQGYHHYYMHRQELKYVV